MIKKIVFFCSAPVIKQHYKRFGVEILKDNGFEVWVYDFSPIVFPTLHNSATYSDNHTSKDYFLFHEEKEAIQAIQSLGSGCFVVMIGLYQAENFKIYQTLSRTTIPYALFANVTYPGGLTGIEGSLFLKFFFKFYRFNLKKLKHFLYKPMLAPIFGIRSPSICVLGGENTLKDNGNAALIGKKTELLWAHAYDYDEYLDHLHKRGPQENIAVFIDLGAPMFPWDQLLPNGVTHLTVERYYPSLCRFLDYVEKELELEVVIAAHPKSNHVGHPKYFGRRRTLRDQTLHLIKKSKLVISHNSTALTYVVLEKKPLLFLTTAEYKSDLSYSKFMKTTALSLGTSLINIDEEPYSINWEKELPVNEAVYLKYRQQYIKKEGSEELNTWQILANRLKKWQ
tara:strand:- start:781 stop:1968 length:1188 start_codon:yes stop_codon:yes gene_type:complete